MKINVSGPINSLLPLDPDKPLDCFVGLPIVKDGKNIWNEIKSLGYGTPLNVATIFPDYDDALKSLREIQSRVDDIKFSNHYILGELWNKEHQFDKVAYSKELTVYELVPTKIET